MTQFIMLGTGNASSINNYNSCFVITNQHSTMLVNAGGGSEIIKQLHHAKINPIDIDGLFLSSSSMENILGAIWLIKYIAEKGHPGRFRICGTSKAIDVINYMCNNILPSNLQEKLQCNFEFCEITDGEMFGIGDIAARCFDLHSTTEEKIGFRALFSCGTIVVYLGDEKYSIYNNEYASDTDVLVCRAFCLDEDKGMFEQNNIKYTTAFEVGKLADKLQTNSVILCNIDDYDSLNNKELYLSEIKQNFSGNVFIPKDLEIISI